MPEQAANVRQIRNILTITGNVWLRYNSFMHSSHPLRIFFISGLVTILATLFVGIELGLSALIVTIALILIEVTFSFDNAIINAKILAKMSKFWQTIFLTIGIVIAVFGMRLVFPIAIVMVTAGLPAGEVIDLALNQPEKYKQALEGSHTAIASFGGMFLLMLGLHFFFDPHKRVNWLNKVESSLQKIRGKHTHSLISFAVLAFVSVLPVNPHPKDTFVAGLIGIITYAVVHGLAEMFSSRQEQKEKGKMVARTGMAGFVSFLYLEVLDASFSLDGVIGAFAITQDVVLIAIGLGVGALWVRSLTVFMVRRKVLHAFKYLEHGAHYTIGFLSAVLITSLFIDIPEAIPGLVGLIIIGLSVFSSRRDA